MGTSRAGWKENQLSGSNLPFPIGRFQNPLATENIESFLIFIVVVVRISGLLGRDFVNTDHRILRSAKRNEFPSEILIIGMLTLVTGWDIFNFGMFDLFHGTHPFVFLHSSPVFIPMQGYFKSRKVPGPSGFGFT